MTKSEFYVLILQIGCPLENHLEDCKEDDSNAFEEKKFKTIYTRPFYPRPIPFVSVYLFGISYLLCERGHRFALAIQTSLGSCPHRQPPTHARGRDGRAVPAFPTFRRRAEVP